MATLFLSSQHHTIIKLFSVGHDSAEGMGGEDEKYRPAFTVGGLALFTTSYLGLMSIGAGLAIPGGLFMPSILVSAGAPPCMEISCVFGCSWTFHASPKRNYRFQPACRRSVLSCEGLHCTNC